MKKLLYTLCALVAIFASSCSQDEPEMTATVALAGEWYVTIDAVDASGNIVYEDPYGKGRMLMATFNTAANVPTEMFVSDLGKFRDYQIKVPCDIQSMTFGKNEWAPNYKYESQVKIYDGKIVKDGGTQPNGSITDTIEFMLEFDDDPYGFIYHVHGVRYSGLVEND